MGQKGIKGEIVGQNAEAKAKLSELLSGQRDPKTPADEAEGEQRLEFHRAHRGPKVVHQAEDGEISKTRGVGKLVRIPIF